MTDIEKRAEDCANALHIAEYGIKDAYIQGANEQLTIDARKFSIAFCDCTCGEHKRKSCDEHNKTCMLLARYLQLGIQRKQI